MLDSNFKMGKNYYPQVFLEECKYVIKEKKIHNDITDDEEISDFDEGNSDEEILEKIQTKKDSDEKDSSEDGSIEEDFSEEDSDEKNYFFFHTRKCHQKLPEYRRNYYLAYKK